LPIKLLISLQLRYNFINKLAIIIIYKDDVIACKLI